MTINLADSIAQIERDGFVHLPQVFPAEQIAHVLSLSREWHQRSIETLTSNLPALAKNDPFVWNPQNKDFAFLQLMFGSREINDILKHFLNDPWYKQIPADQPNYILRNLLARSSNKYLPMHIDSFLPYGGDHVFVMQVSIVLEDQTRQNGCTVVVPGSHKSGEYVKQESFETATPVETRAGDVVVWDSRIWHGAGENASGGTRWAMIGTFARWWIKQMFKVVETMPQEIYSRLTDSEKAVMGFCSIPHRDEVAGVDMKCGFDSLLEDVSGYRK